MVEQHSESQRAEPVRARTFSIAGPYVLLRGVVIETCATPAEAAERAAHLNKNWGNLP